MKKTIQHMLLNEIKQLKAELRKYKQYSYHDVLTGVYNRRKLEEDLQRFIYEYKRYKINFVSIMVDVINFKEVNTKYGYRAGDKKLKQVVNILKSDIRKGDRLYRYGGDEFIIIMPHTNLKQAKTVIKRLKNWGKLHIGFTSKMNYYNILECLGKRLYEKKT